MAVEERVELDCGGVHRTVASAVAIHVITNRERSLDWSDPDPRSSLPRHSARHSTRHDCPDCDERGRALAPKDCSRQCCWITQAASLARPLVESLTG